MEFGIEKCAMLIMRSGILPNDGRNTTTKKRKNQNARRKENLQISRNIRSGYHQPSGYLKK